MRRLLAMASLALIAALAAAAGPGADSAPASDGGTWWTNGSKHRAPSARLLGSLKKTGACAAKTGARVCFGSKHQLFWVQDTKRDGKSAVAKWAAADRQGRGYCRNAHRKGSWAICTGNFKPGTFIFFRAGLFDLDAKGKGRHGHFNNRDKGRFLRSWSDIQVATG